MDPNPSTTQTDAAYGALREEILNCRLAPGEKIKINEIAAKFGLSPGAVREALSRLAAEYMTVATAQKGYKVAQVSEADLRDLTRTRVTIEQLCLRSAIAHGDVEWETSIVAAYHRLHRIPLVATGASAELNPSWVAAHTIFHRALASACDSPWLLRLRETLYSQSERYRYLSVSLASVERDVDSEHSQLLDACLGRDGDRVAALMDRHLTKTSEILLNSPLLRCDGGRNLRERSSSIGSSKLGSASKKRMRARDDRRALRRPATPKR